MHKQHSVAPGDQGVGKSLDWGLQESRAPLSSDFERLYPTARLVFRSCQQAAKVFVSAGFHAPAYQGSYVNTCVHVSVVKSPGDSCLASGSAWPLSTCVALDK